jgi:hypothetical protein
MAFRDAVILVREVLASAAPDVESGSKVERDRPTEFFWVRRTGGHVTGRIIDHPQITVTTWAGDEVRALELADIARQGLLDVARGATGWHATQVGALYEDPDPVTSQDRATFTAFLTVRAARS